MTLRSSGSRSVRHIKTAYILFCFIFLFVRSGLSVEPAPFDVIPYSSVSSSEGPLSALINPVFSDAVPAAGLSYFSQIYGRNEGCNHIFILNTLGFNFTYIWFNDLYNPTAEDAQPAKTGYYRIGKGFLWENILGAGIDYSFSKSTNSLYDGYKSLSLGLLLRPVSFLSFGIIYVSDYIPE